MPEWTAADLIPGLYFLLLALALLAALRRWLDAVPWRVAAVFGLVLAILLGPVLFGGKILLPLDNLRGHVPFTHLPPTVPHGNLLQGDLLELIAPSQAAVREAFGAGQWPLWNPRVGAGMPLLADPQAQALQPLALAGMALPLDRAAGVVAALRVLCALIFSFLFFRRLELSEGSALAGALAYGLSGFVLLWLGWPMANAAALLPLVLYALVRLDALGGRRDGALATAAIALFLFAGHPETIAWGGLFAAAFGLARLLARPAGTRRPLFLRLILAGTLGLALAAPAWLPAAEAMPRSLRAQRLAETAAPAARPGGAGAELARRWLPIVAPNAYGNSRFVDYWGLSNTNEDAAGFVGSAASLLALLALLAARQRFPQERLVLATVGVALLLLAGIGRFLPILAPSVAESRRPLLLVAFGLSYLAACSLERARRGEMSRRVVAVAAVGLAAVVAWGYLAHPHPEDAARLAVLRFGWLRWQARFLGLAALLLLAWRGRRWLPWAVAPLVAAELLLAHRPANPPMPRALSFAVNVNGPLRFLAEHAGLGRIAGLGRDLPPNLASLYGLADARVYNPMAPAAYAAFTAPITTGWWGELPLFGKPRNPLYARLGVRYLLTAPESVLPPPLARVFADADGAVWEVPRPWPILTLPPGTAGALRRLPAGPARIAARIALPTPAELATGLYQDGNWRAVKRGAPAPAERADPPFVALSLPPGSYRLDLLYRPTAFLHGLLAAALALAAAALAFVPPPRQKR